MINFKELKFKEGNRRSLAMALAAALKTSGKENADQKAWEVARALGDGFLREDVEKHLVALQIPPKVSNQEKRKKQPVEGSINGQIREMLLSGKKVGEVAKELGKTYQRIKNVEKSMKKENENKSNNE